VCAAGHARKVAREPPLAGGMFCRLYKQRGLVDEVSVAAGGRGGERKPRLDLTGLLEIAVVDKLCRD